MGTTVFKTHWKAHKYFCHGTWNKESLGHTKINSKNTLAGEEIAVNCGYE